MPPELVIQGPKAWITLRRPEVANRLERQDLEVLLQHLRDVQAQPEVRVLVLQSQGRHFCSGFNLGEVAQAAAQPGAASSPEATSSTALSAPAHFARVADAIEHARPVTVAVMQGGAFGGAVDLALACDLRVGTPAVRAAVPAVRLGLQFYRTGLERAVRRLPWGVAQRLFLLGQPLTADELERAGFFTVLAGSDDALATEVQRLSEHLLALAPLALTGIKHALVELSAAQALDPARAAAIDAAAALTEQSCDLREGVAAWQEGRAPRFTGL